MDAETNKNLIYSIMIADYYAEMYHLWNSIPEIGLNEADGLDGIQTYLLRNHEQSFVCMVNGHVIGTVMCGNDGRRAFIYHLAVSPEYRRRGIATELVRLAVEKQKSLGMNKCALFILTENAAAKSFWMKFGFSNVHEADTMAMNI